MNIRRWWLRAIGVLIGLWIAYALAGQACAGYFAHLFGGGLARLTKGKVADPRIFIYHRLHEILWLATLVLILVAIILLFRWLFRRSGIAERWHWMGYTVLGWFLLNIGMAAAAQTALFWGLFWQGQSTHNFAQFNFKRILMREAAKPRQAVLLGSSQARAQIDENQLNGLLGDKLWTTELHYPGTRASDLVLIERQLQGTDLNYIICYLSELNFYTGSQGEALPFFMNFPAVIDYYRWGGIPFVAGRNFYYGLLGQILPLFHFRDVIASRCLGVALGDFQQTAYNAALDTNLEARAHIAAKKYLRNAESEFQKRAFTQFVHECVQSGRCLVLCCGQLNPILTRQLDPSLRHDMQAYLRELKQLYSQVVLLDNDSLPPQTEQDYFDLTHVTPAVQAVYTQRLSAILSRLLDNGSPAK